MSSTSLYTWSASMLLDCIVSSNAGSQDHDPLPWISSFSSHHPSPLRFPPLKCRWWLIVLIPNMPHRRCKSQPSSIRFRLWALRLPMERRSLVYSYFGVDIVSVIGDMPPFSRGAIHSLVALWCVVPSPSCVLWVFSCNLLKMYNGFWL